MSRTIDLGTSAEWGKKPVQIDIERLLTTRLLVQANSGGGKSFALRRLLEQLFGAVPHVVIDLDGEFATLREKFPYVLASAGAGGDCKVDTRSAALLARRILEHGFSTIADLSEMKKHDRVRFVRLFLEALMDAPRALWRPLLVVVDEAHQFCPEKDQAESAAAVTDLMTRGRKRGFCGVLATQRISKLNKDAAAEANNKLIGRSALDVDMKRAADELGFTTREQQHQLRQLEEGGFYAFGPAIAPAVVRVKVGPVQTTHPEPGHGKLKPTPAPEKLKAILEKLADLPAQAEAEEGELARLRREVADLQRQGADSKVSTGREGIQMARREATTAALDLVRIGLAEDLKALDLVQRDLGEIAGGVGVALARIRQKLKGLPASVPQPPRQDTPAPRHATTAGGRDLQLSGPQQRILDSLAWLASIRPLDPADRTQLALLADASPTSSGYQNNLGSLRSAGLIEYPTGGTVKLTDAGHAAAQAPARAPTTADLHATLQAKLPRPLWQILEALIGVYPDDLDKERLADRVGASPTSSGYQNNLGRLRSLGFIDYPKPGRAMARAELFLED